MTLNNYDQIDICTVTTSDALYSILGRETGASGTPHLQGYLYFKTPVRLSKLKKLLPKAHWEAAKGTAAQNIAYCSKEDPNPEITGSPPSTQAAGGDKEKDRWANAYALAKVGNLQDVPGDIALRCYRTLKEIAKDNMVKPDDREGTTGVWLCGPAGCGKSRKAREDYPSSYLKMANKWWDGYQNEDTVILDDLDTRHDVLGHHLKIWADRYSFLAENKGGALHIRPRLICVTSQYHPDEIWADQETRDAIKRRFKITRMGGYQQIMKP